MTNLSEFLNPALAPAEPPRVIDMFCSVGTHADKPVLHRYDIVVTAQEYDGPATQVYHFTYAIIGETGASWFFDEYGARKRVLKGTGKRYAHATQELAMFSLRKRTRSRLVHAHWQLTKAHEAIDAYNALFADGAPLEKVGAL